MKRQKNRKKSIGTGHLHTGRGRRNYVRRSFSRKALTGLGGQATTAKSKNSLENKGGAKNRSGLRLVPKPEVKSNTTAAPAQDSTRTIENHQPRNLAGGNGGSRWNSPRVTGLVAAVLLFAALVTAGWSSVSSAKADDEPLEVRASAQTSSLQLAKEYIYAGSRMLAIEDYGLDSNSTPTPTATPTATPSPTSTPTATPTPAANCQSNFSDDFNDGVRSPLWSLYQAGQVSSPVYERNGVLEIDGITDQNSDTYAGYISTCQYPVVGATLSAEIVSPTTGNGGGGNYGIIGYKDTSFRIILAYSYIYYFSDGFTYDSTRDRWVRIRDDAAAQTVYAESSPDGVNWEVRSSIPLAGGGRTAFTDNKYQILLSNGTVAGYPSKDDVKYDNFSYTNTGFSTVPGGTAPTGRLDSVTVGPNYTVQIKGWSFDPTSSSASNYDDVYLDGPIGTGIVLVNASANESRPDVNSLQNITGNHGFTVNLTMFDSNPHSIYVYSKDLNGNNPTLVSNAPLTFQAGP